MTIDYGVAQRTLFLGLPPPIPPIRTMGLTRMTKNPPMTFLQPLFSRVTTGRKVQAPTTHPTVGDRPQVRLGDMEER